MFDIPKKFFPYYPRNLIDDNDFSVSFDLFLFRIQNKKYIYFFLIDKIGG